MIRVVTQAALVTLLVVAITQAVSYAVWGNKEGGYDLSIVVTGVLIPLATCFPISLVLLSQRQALTGALAALEQAHRELQEQASRDPMTGLPHRQAFFARLAALGRPEGCVLMVDVDHFKSVNDRHGHAAGDQALQLIADALAEAAGRRSVVARFGGEEFCVFLPYADPSEGHEVGDRIRLSVGQLDFAPGGLRHPLSVSIGVAIARPGVSAEAAISAADVALYQAKAAGRNRVIRAAPRRDSDMARLAARAVPE